MFKFISTLKNDFSLDNSEILEGIEALRNNETDFEVGDFRVIAHSAIDEVMVEELGNDEYILGCFNSWFLAGILGVDEEVISTLQAAEGFEGIGRWVISSGKLEEVQQDYVSADGYGHHFNHYDGNEYEFSANDTDYYAFRIN